jgi:hypothetical protein
MLWPGSFQRHEQREHCRGPSTSLRVAQDDSFVGRPNRRPQDKSDLLDDGFLGQFEVKEAVATRWYTEP